MTVFATLMALATFMIVMMWGLVVWGAVRWPGDPAAAVTVANAFVLLVCWFIYREGVLSPNDAIGAWRPMWTWTWNTLASVVLFGMAKFWPEPE